MSNNRLSAHLFKIHSPPRKLLSLVGFSDWWGNYPPDVLDRDDAQTVGGGEAGALNTAFQLAALGHEVTYCSVATPGTYKGVRFERLSKYLDIYLEGQPWDAVLMWSVIDFLKDMDGDEAILFVQQLNDVGFQAGWWDKVYMFVSPSWTHAEAMGRYFPEGHGLDFHAVGNGVNLDFFPKVPPDPASRPMNVGWWSSPDRGLHHLLKAWPEIKARVPKARLRVFYQVKQYIERGIWWGSRATPMAGLLEKLLIETERLDVELVDKVPRKTLAKYQLDTRVQAYPCEGEGFTEGFATSILEALSAGCLTVTRKVDALPELWDGVVWWLDGHVMDDDFVPKLADKVVRGLTEWAEDPNRSPSLATMRAKAETWPWSAVGKEMEVAIHKAIARKGIRLSKRQRAAA